MGDIFRREINSVKINKRFTYLNGFQDEEARKIFNEKENIHKIPVIGQGGCILGDYSRWSDTEEVYIRWIFDQVNIWKRIKKYLKALHVKQIYIVKADEKEHFSTHLLEELLKQKKCQYIDINKEQTPALIREKEKSILICANEDEIRSIYCYAGVALPEANDALGCYTVTSLYEKLSRYDSEERIHHYDLSEEAYVMNPSMHRLQNNGVKIYGVYNGYNTLDISDYFIDFARENAELKKIYPIAVDGGFWPLKTKMAKGFFGELLDERDYKEGIAQKEILKGYKNHLPDSDYESKYYNVIGGRRKTCWQPEQYQGTVYFFGACIFMGAYVEDQYTIESWLQKKVNEQGYAYRIENCGSHRNIFEEMQKITYRAGDIIILWTGSENIPGIKSVNIRKVMEKNKIHADQVLGTISHHNHVVSGLIADKIYELIKPALSRENLSKQVEVKYVIENYGEVFGRYFRKIYLEKYFSTVFFDLEKENGCIVLDKTIHPKQYTHKLLQLIEEDIDCLIVFCPINPGIGYQGTMGEYVSELLPITQREKNIIFIPGDRIVPYENYFHSYYVGETLNVMQAETDTHIFADCIAKPLHICRRYALRNDRDEKTKVYNSVLRRILPEHGTEFVEVTEEQQI